MKMTSFLPFLAPWLGCHPIVFPIVSVTLHFILNIWLSMVLQLLFVLLQYSRNAGFRPFPSSHCFQKIALLFPRYNLARLIMVEFIINILGLLDL